MAFFKEKCVTYVQTFALNYCAISNYSLFTKPLWVTLYRDISSGPKSYAYIERALCEKSHTKILTSWMNVSRVRGASWVIEMRYSDRPPDCEYPVANSIQTTVATQPLSRFNQA